MWYLMACATHHVLCNLGSVLYYGMLWCLIPCRTHHVLCNLHATYPILASYPSYVLPPLPLAVCCYTDGVL